MARPKAYVTRRIPEAGLELLRERFDVGMNEEDRPLTRPEFLAAIGDADAVVCLLTEKMDDEAMEAAKRAKAARNAIARATGEKALDCLNPAVWGVNRVSIPARRRGVHRTRGGFE